MMEYPLIFNKTAKSGHAIEVRLREYLPGQHVAALYVNGRYVPGHARPTALAAPRSGMTFCLGNTKIAVGLTDDEAATVNHAIDSANAVWKASAAGQFAALNQERQQLVDHLNGLMDEAANEFEQMMEDESNDGACPPENCTPEIRVAENALQDFDSAHPEVQAALAAEQDERVKRFLAYD